MFQQIFAVVAPVILISAVGYVWQRRRMPFDTNMVARLVTNVATPCFLVSVLLKSNIDLATLASVMVVGMAVLLVVAAASFLLVKAARQPLRVFLPVLTFPNSGNMGLPLCYFAFGDEGLAFAVAVFAVNTVFQFSLGMAIARGSFSLHELLRTPVLWSLLAAFALMAAQTQLPLWIANTVEVLGNLVIPLMLLSLGTSIASLKVTTFGRSAGLAVFRLLAGFGAAAVMVYAFGLEGAARGAVIVQSSMPAAVFSYMFALRYNNRPDEVAGIVLISTIISFLTLPLLLAYVLGG